MSNYSNKKAVFKREQLIQISRSQMIPSLGPQIPDEMKRRRRGCRAGAKRRERKNSSLLHNGDCEIWGGVGFWFWFRIFRAFFFLLLVRSAFLVFLLFFSVPGNLTSYFTLKFCLFLVEFCFTSFCYFPVCFHLCPCFYIVLSFLSWLPVHLFSILFIFPLILAPVCSPRCCLPVSLLWIYLS